MTHAYEKLYLYDAQLHLGHMLEAAVYDFKQDPANFFQYFLNSSHCYPFETAAVYLMSGSNGLELAERVMFEANPTFQFPKLFNRGGTSREFWVGWALAFYQWYTSKPFSEIVSYVPIDDILLMYTPFHEMDISHFCSEIDRRIQACLS